MADDPSLDQAYEFWLVHFFLMIQQPSSPSLLAQFVAKLSSLEDCPADVLRYCHVETWLSNGEMPENVLQDESYWAYQVCWPLLLARAVVYLRSGAPGKAAEQLDQLPDQFSNCLEALRLRARVLEYAHQYDQALSLLLACAKRFPTHLGLQAQLLVMTVEACSQEHAIPALRSAVSHHGESHKLLAHLCRISQLKNRAADARRYALRDRAFKLTSDPQKLHLSNLGNCYDRLGLANWLLYPPSSHISMSSLPLAMREPFVMQYASVQAPASSAKPIVKSIEADYAASSALNREIIPYSAKVCASKAASLTIAWISSDLSNHPVMRFLYGYFASRPTQDHRHVIVDAHDHLGESKRGLFESLPSLEVVNAGSGDYQSKLNVVRSLNADVAIDLNGWTGGHFLRGFAARVAPVQVNYLGYFATTGLEAMDWWLGDDQLFPAMTDEWHSERLFRLPRCFIAWQPQSPLPEASLDVVESISSGGIRFGSFNHNRKLSDEALRLWGLLISSLSGSSLVLKANEVDDQPTQELLRRRMVRQGLDPERVIWLPRTTDEVSHLQQYRHIDVALDTFPNGGCTTTCEALWMGTPVITLTGRNYVSRMSTAVLAGAGMSDWCASSQQDYLQIARKQADTVNWLRQNREHWRSQIQANPLGNASDLMGHLDHAFVQMASTASR
uniref:O-linked N-acetylglucosamine transferase, SPINDLY family protein n=1 Tax=Cyanobium sp. TaxID=2164130 RepID=UPI004048A875